jgi:hypothetical protein
LRFTLEKADSDLSEAMEDDSREEEEKKVTIDAAKALCGRIGELGEMLERVWKSSLFDGRCRSEEKDGETAEGEVMVMERLRSCRS